jgi:hypothetical protein
MAAAAAPLNQPRDFVAIAAADLQRFRAGCKGLVVGALRYRAQQFGTRFRTSRPEIRRWCKNAYSLSAIDYVLAQLRDEGFIRTQSDGRGFFVSMLEMQQTPKLVSQSFKVQDSALIERARGNSKEEDFLKKKELQKLPGSEEPKKPLELVPVKPAETPPTEKPPENPIEEARQIGLDRPERFTTPALRIGIQRFRNREVKKNAGGLLYVIVRSIPGALKSQQAKQQIGKIDAHRVAIQSDGVALAPALVDDRPQVQEPKSSAAMKAIIGKSKREGLESALSILASDCTQSPDDFLEWQRGLERRGVLRDPARCERDQ